MSYKSLLFCPDEKTARVVTQVLSELEFTVELSNEPFATVKKLTDEHFDALVVDCESEQDASLLFKAARNSSLNHSSLSVAVVEGQAGVAKAFRIGANLVLTKPVNVEQSKGTLRVARGLLRKGEAKAASAAAGPGSIPTISPAKPVAHEPATFSAVSPASLQPVVPQGPASAVPFSALELEQEPTPAPEPSEVAVLESLPVDGKPAAAAEPMWAPRSQAAAEPIAASTGGQAAAAAPALAKTPELKLSGASPMITNDPIVQESSVAEPMPEISLPTFSALEAAHSSSGGGKKFIKAVALLLIFGGGGYVAWQKLQPMQYLHGSTPGQTVKQPVALPEPTTGAPASPSAAQVGGNTAEAAPSTTLPDLGVVSSTAASPSDRNFTPETIHVQELPMNSEQKAGLAAKSQQPTVIQVKPRNQGTPKVQPSPPTPPSLPLNLASNSNTALNSIVATDAPAPKPAGSFRVSQGVSQGLVVKKVAPVYSATALQLGKQGSVELVATISKDGSVSGVRVLSGDLMLANSAVAAVKQWKYHPYLLNGEPVEIETQITVNFRLPH